MTEESLARTLAGNVRRALKARGMCRHDLAVAVGMSDSTLARIMDGRGLPRVSTLVLMARALGVRPMELMDGVGAPRVVPLGPPMPPEARVPVDGLWAMRLACAYGLRDEPQRWPRLPLWDEEDKSTDVNPKK